MNPSADTPTDQLPAVLPLATDALPITADAAPVVPALIADAGDQAAWRYIDFFTANIRQTRCKPLHRIGKT